ncbi:MAG: FtsQ-type POTRA domain-containing protein [Alphaproteobacteria bacterium]|nr:FtsQ-type POTRA domain-containing protein [Alphaproteobacteria bacterium]
MTAIVGAVGLGGWYLTSSGWVSAQLEAANTAFMNATASAGLRVQDVVLTGRTRANAEEILSALNLQRGSPIFSVDIDEARERIESLGWIASAEIARRLPDVIFVRVVERKPLAVWQHDGKSALVARDGEIIQRSGLDAFGDFPLIVGEGAPERAAQLLDLLNVYPAVARATESAVRVSDRRWNLRLTGGIDVRLPEKNIAIALDRLEEFQREHSLFDRDVIAVDLRVPDRLIFRVNPNTVKARKIGEKDT